VRLVSNDRAALWAGGQLGQTFLPPFAGFWIVNRFGHACGAAVLNDYADRNIELTCVGRGAFSRDVCRELARVAFNVNGCERITIRTGRKNVALVGMALRWGWRVEGILRRWYGDDDAVVMGMLREECRFLEKAN
jgi:RimJ/RimL family protein N-acetyltransferase